jgi:methionyl-tRNA formyltransferase
MRLVFAGTPPAAVPTLHALHAAGHEIVAVVTQPDAPGKRGKQLHPSAVKRAALELGLPVLTPRSASEPEFVTHIASLEADVAAVVAYGQILRPALLAAVRTHWINLHFSLLPAWRGAAPVQRALMAGDEFTGASTFVIEEGLDTGPVIGTLTERIRSTDTTGDLLERLSHAGAPLMVASLEAVHSGAAVPVPQGEEGVSVAPKISREDASVRWEWPALAVDRQVRACTPAPGAWTTLPDGTTARLGPVRLRDSATSMVPGQLQLVDGEVRVGTGAGSVALTWIQPAGRTQTDALAWWRGARLSDGAQLGEA